MGMFGYICNKCNQPINGGEQTVMRHIRHGEIVGHTRGKYDSYGRVYEDDVFRSNDEASGINSHSEICKSEFLLEDSKGFNAKIYKGTPLTWMGFRQAKVAEGAKDLSDETYEEWEHLTSYENVPKSGIQSFHAYCFDRMSDEEKQDLTLSSPTPNQSCGKPRVKFCKK